MGLVGSGTNNARLAGLLRNLAQFYHKEPMDLFMVRLAQVRGGGVCVECVGGGGCEPKSITLGYMYTLFL